MKKLVPAITIDNLKAASDAFEQIMQEKITDAIEAKKYELAQAIDEKKKLDPVDHDELDPQGYRRPDAGRGRRPRGDHEGEPLHHRVDRAKHRRDQPEHGRRGAQSL